MKILKDWYTFSHASKLIGKNRNYFVNRYRINPDIFKEECLLEVDGIKFINKEGIEFLELGGVQPNPRDTLVYEGIDLCRKEGVDFVLAVGGGSAIDSSKAIAAGVVYDGDFWDYYSTNMVVDEALKIGTILTIPAAGSEGSADSVITKEDAP